MPVAMAAVCIFTDDLMRNKCMSREDDPGLRLHAFP